jgi:hypothetical protein
MSSVTGHVSPVQSTGLDLARTYESMACQQAGKVSELVRKLNIFAGLAIPFGIIGLIATGGIGLGVVALSGFAVMGIGYGLKTLFDERAIRLGKPEASLTKFDRIINFIMLESNSTS